MSSHSLKTVYVFTHYGLGNTDNNSLQINLTKKFLSLIASDKPLPAQICFYTDGVKLCVHDSPVLTELIILANLGVELVICSTCLETFGLTNEVAVGVIGGMVDIITALTHAEKVIPL